MEPLTDRIDAHLKKLRKADTQAQAIAWMTAAYKLMEESIDALKEKPVTSTIERVIYVQEPPPLVVVQRIPETLPLPVTHAIRQPHHTQRGPVWLDGKTHVYPEVPMPPPKPIRTPKAWTHKDTVRLERAVKGEKK